MRSRRLVIVPLVLMVMGLAGCGESGTSSTDTIPAPLLDELPSETDSLYLLVSGTVEPGDGVTIEGGAQTERVTATGSEGLFQAYVLLVPGSLNELSFVAVRGSDTSEAVTHDVTQVGTPPDELPDPWSKETKDIPPPPVVDQLPAVVHVPEVTITGTVRVGDGLVAYLMGGTVDGELLGYGGAFAVTVPLEEDQDNPISLYAESPAGWKSDPVVVHVLHETPSTVEPPLEITIPAPEVDPLPAEVWTPSTVITGSADTAFRVIKVTGGGGDAMTVSASDGSFSVGVALLADQTNVFSVTAEDLDGHVSEAVEVGTDHHTPAGVAKYPIILHHGICGWDDIAGVEYFYGVADVLEEEGFQVYMTAVSPINSIHHRASQLKELILGWTSGKVNIIAHSMGGLDARYMMTHLDMADHVASLTTVATPHRGSVLADVILGIVPGPAEVLIDLFFNVLGWDVDGAYDLSVDYVTGEFNPTTPDVKGVAYYSWAGVSDPSGDSGNDLPAFFIPTWLILQANDGDNDGLVALESAKWGDFLGILPANHFDEVGLIAGIGNQFDYLSFFVDEAYRLVDEGF